MEENSFALPPNRCWTCNNFLGKLCRDYKNFVSGDLTPLDFYESHRVFRTCCRNSISNQPRHPYNVEDRFVVEAIVSGEKSSGAKIYNNKSGTLIQMVEEKKLTPKGKGISLKKKVKEYELPTLPGIPTYNPPDPSEGVRKIKKLVGGGYEVEIITGRTFLAW